VPSSRCFSKDRLSDPERPVEVLPRQPQVNDAGPSHRVDPSIRTGARGVARRRDDRMRLPRKAARHPDRRDGRLLGLGSERHESDHEIAAIAT